MRVKTRSWMKAAAIAIVAGLLVSLAIGLFVRHTTTGGPIDAFVRMAPDKLGVRHFKMELNGIEVPLGVGKVADMKLPIVLLKSKRLPMDGNPIEEFYSSGVGTIGNGTVCTNVGVDLASTVRENVKGFTSDVGITRESSEEQIRQSLGEPTRVSKMSKGLMMVYEDDTQLDVYFSIREGKLCAVGIAKESFNSSR